MNLADLLIEWRDAREAIFATPLDLKVGPPLFARLAAAELALMQAARRIEPAVLCTFGPPADRQREWLLRFEDADEGDAHFDAEDEAVSFFRRAANHWTCTLFVTAEMPRDPAPAAAVGLPCTWCGVVHEGGCGRMISGGQWD